MSCIHFKFRSGADFEPVFFDGHAISVKELKEAIIAKKQMGKGTDFKLELTNSSTNHDYSDENEMIPRNSSIIVYRVPLHYTRTDTEESVQNLTVSQLSQIANLAEVDASEEDKIRAVMRQSEIVNQESSVTLTPARTSKVPICFNCKQIGHVIRSCPSIIRNSVVKEPVHIYLKSQLGLQSNFKPGTTPSTTNNSINIESVPDFLICSLCSKLLSNAVLLPCCGNSFCDLCIQNYLVDHNFICPSCTKSLKLDDIIPNISLRKSVTTYQIGRYPKAATPRDNTQEVNNNGDGTIEVAKILDTNSGQPKPPISASSADSMTCVNNIPNIASSFLSKIPFQNMGLPTSSYFMNPFFETLSHLSANSQNLYSSWPPNDEMVEVAIPYLTVPYVQSVLSGERVLTKDEFKSLKSQLEKEMRNVRENERSSYTSDKRTSRHRSKSYKSSSRGSYNSSPTRHRLSSSKKEIASINKSERRRTRSQSKSSNSSLKYEPITLEIIDNMKIDASPFHRENIKSPPRKRHSNENKSRNSSNRNSPKRTSVTREKHRHRSRSDSYDRRYERKYRDESKFLSRRSIRDRDSYHSKYHR